MLKVYKEKQREDPEHAVAPIPSQVVRPPVPAQVLIDLCFTARYEQEQPAVAQEHVHATALALLHAVYVLESDPDAQQIQQHNQVTASPRRKYFLKRNYAGMVCSSLSCRAFQSKIEWCLFDCFALLAVLLASVSSLQLSCQQLSVNRFMTAVNQQYAIRLHCGTNR